MKDDIKTFLKYAGFRALRTFAQTFISTIGTTAVVLTDVNWKVVLSASLLASVVSIATSVAFGIPEVKEE